MLLTVDSNLFDPNVFYSRQIVLPELGRQGQEKLRIAIWHVQRVAVAYEGWKRFGEETPLSLLPRGTDLLKAIWPIKEDMLKEVKCEGCGKTS